MGSGKSTVSRVLRDEGFDVLDADQVVQQVLSPGGAAEREILSAFGGAGVVGADGGLDRRALGRVVFGDAERLAKLEAILHPRVRDLVTERRRALERDGKAVAFYDVPLLFEKKMESQFDHILVVSTARDLRLARVTARTGLSAAEVEARWASQLPPEYKEARASAVIANDGDLAELRVGVRTALTALRLPTSP